MRIRTVSRLVVLAGAVALALGTISCTSTPPASPAAQTPTAAPTAQAPSASAAHAPAAKAAASVAGPWTWNVDAGGNQITHSVVFKQEGEKLTGKFTDSYDNTTVDIQDGKIHDGQVTFTVTRPFMDNGTLTLKFDGKYDGTAITGKMDIIIGDQPTTSDWNAKRGA